MSQSLKRFIMIQTCKFNPKTDITPTNPDLVGDFKGSIRTGVVKDTSAQAFYNMLKEGKDIGPRLSSEFDFIEYDKATRAYRKKLMEEDPSAKFPGK